MPAFLGADFFDVDFGADFFDALLVDFLGVDLAFLVDLLFTVFFVAFALVVVLVDFAEAFLLTFLAGFFVALDAAFLPAFFTGLAFLAFAGFFVVAFFVDFFGVFLAVDDFFTALLADFFVDFFAVFLAPFLGAVFFDFVGISRGQYQFRALCQGAAQHDSLSTGREQGTSVASLPTMQSWPESAYYRLI